MYSFCIEIHSNIVFIDLKSFLKAVEEQAKEKNEDAMDEDL